MEFSPIVKVPFQRTEKEDCFSICFNFKIFNSGIDYLTNVLTRNDYPPNFIDLRVKPFLKVNRLIQKTNFVNSAKTLSKANMIKHTSNSNYSSIAIPIIHQFINHVLIFQSAIWHMQQKIVKCYIMLLPPLSYICTDIHFNNLYTPKVLLSAYLKGVILLNCSSCKVLCFNFKTIFVY